METIVLEVKNKSDIKFWLDLAKKTGTKAFVVEEPNELMGEIQLSLKEAKKMNAGVLPKRSLKQMLNGK